MDKVAWVTGGSRGIGRATALRLAENGMDVAVGFHGHADAADEVVEAIRGLGRRAIAVGGNMAEASAVTRMHEEIATRLGPVGVLVASHGVYTRVGLPELDLTAWQATLEVNLTGTFLVTQAILPAMRRAGWGRLVYLGSIKGRTGSTHGVHYAASKAGLLGLCRSVALAAAADGVTVNLVAPGMIDTDMLAGDTPDQRAERHRRVPVRRIGSPEEVANAIAFLVSDAAGYVTGTEMRVDGGFDMG